MSVKSVYNKLNGLEPNTSAELVRYSAEQATELIETAGRVKLRKYRKHPRRPKKPPVKREHDPQRPHVSVARVLAQRKKDKKAKAGAAT